MERTSDSASKHPGSGTFQEEVSGFTGIDGVICGAGDRVA